jgi:hypothetical protein
MTTRLNLFTYSDACLIAAILDRIAIHRSVVVLVDADADMHVGPPNWEPISQRQAMHPEQWVGNYSRASDPLGIAQDLMARKAELLRYGIERMAITMGRR